MNKRETRKSVLWMVILILISLTGLMLASCTTGALSINARCTLSVQERWRMELDVVYAKAEVQLLGDQIDQIMAQSISQMKSQGVSASYSKRKESSGNMRYHIKASGQGYQLLNKTFFDGLATITQEPSTEEIYFSYAPFGSYFGAAMSRQFNLVGSEVISSNGFSAKKNTATWNNPMNTMEARIKPASGIDPSVLLWIIGIIVVFGIMLAVGKNRGRRCSSCGHRIPKRAEFCPECGAYKEGGNL